MSTITAVFPPQQRTKGVATRSGFAAACAIIGMLAAGALLEQFSWRSIFVTNAVAAALAAAPLAPDTKDAHPAPPEMQGVVTTALGTGALVGTRATAAFNGLWSRVSWRCCRPTWKNPKTP